jgi:hypothetical protein
MTRAAARLALAAALSAGLSACAGDQNPVRDAFVGAGLGTTLPKRPDFVEASRPASTEYMPVGVSAPPRPSAKRTPEQVKALEAELDGTRARNQSSADEARRLATTPAPEPVRVAPITDAPAARR